MLGVASCEAPLSVGERGLLPSPAPGERTAPPTGPITLAPRGTRAVERLGQATSLATRVTTGRTIPVVTGDQQVRLDYTDAAIATVATDVVRDVLALPVEVDSSVQGRMTLKTPGRVPITEVPRLLDQALLPYGYGIAMVNGRVRVGPLADLGDAGDGPPGSRTIRLHYVTANDLIVALRPALANSVRLAPADNGNAIVATGPEQAVDALQDMVNLFDTDMLASRSFGIYPLTNASPVAVARELTQIVGQRAGTSSVRFAPIQRLNAVLVVADQPRALAEARRLITDMDVESAATAYIHVYPVINRRAGDLADVLALTFGAPQPGRGSRTPPGGAFGQLSVGSPTTSRSGLGVRVPGMSSGGGGQDRSASSPADSGQGLPSGGDILLGPLDAGGAGVNALGLSAPVRIQPDPGRNALVVLASPSDYKIIEQAIRALDVRPRQVLIEAVIAEVQLNEGLKYGLDVLFNDSSNTASLQSGVNPLTTLLSGAPAAATVGQGLAYLFHNKNVKVVVQALGTLVNINVVSAPRVLVLDNETATLQVGDQVPILVQQQQSTDNAAAPLVNSIQMRDTGVIMSVTPRIGAGGNLSLDIFQEVSSATPTLSSAIDSPTISVRRIESTINVQTGDTIALGGLMQDQASRTKAGVPFLSNIPFLGWLFGSLNNTTRRTELLVMLNPRVVEEEGQARALTEELRMKLYSISPGLAEKLVPPRSPRTIPAPRLPATPNGPGQYFE
ncbi:MAG: type II secretion system secretin GspD [Acetobacteraceae bacterium]